MRGSILNSDLVSIQERLKLDVISNEKLVARLSHELHLLLHASPDQCVVTIQPELECLAIIDLFLDVSVDETAQLLTCWRALPRLVEDLRQLLHAPLRHDDPIARLVCAVSDQRVGTENQGADEDEVDQRLSDKP